MSTSIQNDSQYYSNESNSLSESTGLSHVTLNNNIYIISTIYDSETKSEITSNNAINKIWKLSFDEVFNRTTPKIASTIWSTEDIGSENQPFLYHSPLVSDEKTTSIFAFAPSMKFYINNDTKIEDNNKNKTTTNTTSVVDNSQKISVFSFDLNVGKRWELRTEADQKNLIPFTREEYSLSIDPNNKDHVYLFGGMNKTAAQNDFWMYSLRTLEWQKIDVPSTIPIRCGHTSSVLSDGRIVFIGGHTCQKKIGSAVVTDFSKQHTLDLISMETISVFDTASSRWLDSPVIKGDLPSPRIFHSAIPINNKDILICGGQNNVVAPFQIYMGSEKNNINQMTAILDTNSWTWRIPKPSYIYQPYPQSNGVISLVNDTKLIYGYGDNYYNTFDTFNTFNIQSETWESISPVETREKGLLDPLFSLNSSGNYDINIMSTTTILCIVLGCIGFSILILYSLGLWVWGSQKLHFKVITLLKSVKNELWKPRIGEPNWAEASRLALKILFFIVFIYFIFFLTNQVINSPIINQISYENDANMTVNVPDIRFCFDGWTEEAPFISCTTDFGIQCSEYTQQIEVDNKSKQQNKVCFMFKAPLSFKLGRTSKRFESSGSYLKFDYYYSSNEVFFVDKKIKNYKLQIDLYNSLQEHETTKNETQSLISRLIFNNKNIPETTIKVDKSLQTSDNAYIVDTQLTSSISFELTKRILLKSDTWNYLGIASSVTTNHELETKIVTSSIVAGYSILSGSPQAFGSLRVLPSSFKTKVSREQKAFAYINAVGIFGGLFGLLYGLQASLFGYRPRSPWGYFHRWSFGNFRSSLINGLQNNFFPSTSIKTGYNIPMVIKGYTPLRQSNFPSVRSQSINNDQVLSINTVYDESLIKNAKESDILKPPRIMIPSEEENMDYLVAPSPIFNFSSVKENNSDQLRMALIEERLYTLEKLFQAYYIDDEIFRSLGQALESNNSSVSSSIRSHTSSDSIFQRNRRYD